MIRRRAKDAGIGTKISCHTFSATGITAYLQNSAVSTRWPSRAEHPNFATLKEGPVHSDHTRYGKITLNR